MPRLTGALITVACFMPIGFAKSTTGEYAGGIFWIVGTAVLFSWVVSGIITPYLAVKMLPKDFGKHHHGGDPYDKPFYRKLRGLIDLALERRWIVIGATVASLAVAIWEAIRTAAILSVQRAARAGRRAHAEGRRFVRRDDRAGQTNGAGLREGRGRPLLYRVHGRRPAALYSFAQSGAAEPGYAVFIVMTKDMEARERVRSRLMASVDEEFPHAGCASRLELGPPVGFPVQFRVVGPDTQKVREIAREVQAVMASSPKLRDVQFDWNDPVRALRVDIDQDKARALGLAPADVGS